MIARDELAVDETEAIDLGWHTLGPSVAASRRAAETLFASPSSPPTRAPAGSIALPQLPTASGAHHIGPTTVPTRLVVSVGPDVDYDGLCDSSISPWPVERFPVDAPDALVGLGLEPTDLVVVVACGDPVERHGPGTIVSDVDEATVLRLRRERSLVDEWWRRLTGILSVVRASEASLMMVLPARDDIPAMPVDPVVGLTPEETLSWWARHAHACAAIRRDDVDTAAMLAREMLDRDGGNCATSWWLLACSVETSDAATAYGLRQRARDRAVWTDDDGRALEVPNLVVDVFRRMAADLGTGLFDLDEAQLSSEEQLGDVLDVVAKLVGRSDGRSDAIVRRLRWGPDLDVPTELDAVRLRRTIGPFPDLSRAAEEFTLTRTTGLAPVVADYADRAGTSHHVSLDGRVILSLENAVGQPGASCTPSRTIVHDLLDGHHADIRTPAALSSSVVHYATHPSSLFFIYLRSIDTTEPHVLEAVSRSCCDTTVLFNGSPVTTVAPTERWTRRDTVLSERLLRPGINVITVRWSGPPTADASVSIRPLFGALSHLKIRPREGGPR